MMRTVSILIVGCGLAFGGVPAAGQADSTLAQEGIYDRPFIGSLSATSIGDKNKVKILAMHHHLVGIPDTGSDRVTIIDAGDVLRTILATNVDLVLCGHKHRPWIWNFKNLSIVNAGTASSERTRGLFKNAYNIITIKNKKIKVDLKIVGGHRTPLNDIVKKYSRFGEE